jgi:hypothetical protein
VTNKEALIANVGFSVPDNMVEKAMIDNDVTGTTEYAKDAAESIDLCTIPILKRVLSEPDVSEGGYSIRFDRASVEKRLESLLEENDMSTGPTVTGKSVW